MWGSVYAVLTTFFWLSVTLAIAVSAGLIAFGGIKRRYGFLMLGIFGLLLSVGWLSLNLVVEAVVK
jgi:hypothetical protein